MQLNPGINQRENKVLVVECYFCPKVYICAFAPRKYHANSIRICSWMYAKACVANAFTWNPWTSLIIVQSAIPWFIIFLLWNFFLTSPSSSSSSSLADRKLALQFQQHRHCISFLGWSFVTLELKLNWHKTLFKMSKKPLTLSWMTAPNLKIT